MIFLFLQTVTSHLIFSNPSVWDGGKPLYELENPMTPDTINWFCKGNPRKDNAVILELLPGTTLNVPIICGEAPIGSNKEQATQFCDNDRNALHGGGGCSLSIANGDTDDFTIITIAYDCPKLDWSSDAFQIPEGLPEVINGKCSWTWIPSLDFAQQESYNNCFSCSVKSSTNGTLTGGTKLQPNPLNTYKDTFADGPLNDWSIISQIPEGLPEVQENSNTIQIPDTTTTTTTTTITTTTIQIPDTTTTIQIPDTTSTTTTTTTTTTIQIPDTTSTSTKSCVCVTVG